PFRRGRLLLAMLMIGVCPGRLIDLGGGDQRNEPEMLQARREQPGSRPGDQTGQQDPPQHSRSVAGKGESMAHVMRRAVQYCRTADGGDRVSHGGIRSEVDILKLQEARAARQDARPRGSGPSYSKCSAAPANSARKAGSAIAISARARSASVRPFNSAMPCSV